MNFREVVERSLQLRKIYHRLERQYHEKEWTVEEDALAFLNRCWIGWSSNNVNSRSKNRLLLDFLILDEKGTCFNT